MRHFNPSISEDKNRILNLKSGDDNSEVADYIQPTIEIERRINIVKTTGQGATGTFAIYTTPTDKDFYITNIILHYIKDAACDLATGGVWSLSANIDGTSQALVSLSVITLTAQDELLILQFDKPLKIDRGNAINSNGTFGAGAMRRNVTIYGYTVETFKGSN